MNHLVWETNKGCTEDCGCVRLLLLVICTMFGVMRQLHEFGVVEEPFTQVLLMWFTRNHTSSKTVRVTLPQRKAYYFLK
jgi:hypothetical protein